MMVVGFWNLVCFPVGSAEMNMCKLIHWSCRVSLFPVGQQHFCCLAGWAA